MTHILALAVAMAATGLLPSQGKAQTRKLVFKSAADQFELLLNGGKGSVGGKPANLIGLQEALPMLNSPLGNACPKLNGTPEVAVTDGAQTRSIYVKQGIVTDGESCLNVTGDGLHYFPIHRDFLIGPKQDGIELKDSLKIFRQGTKLLDLKKKNGQWVNAAPEFLMDWDFLERFENSLREFDVRLRVQTGISQGKPKMIVQTGADSYEFFKVTGVMWAVKKPGGAWLIASDDWSFWHDFERSQLEDRYFEQIRLITSESAEKSAKLQALERLENSWSPNQREMYHKLLLGSVDADLHAIALKRLKRKPSLDTAGVMVQYLDKAPSEELKRDAGAILKSQYPKGPKYDPSAKPMAKAKVVEFWRTWWRNAQNPR